MGVEGCLRGEFLQLFRPADVNGGSLNLDEILFLEPIQPARVDNGGGPRRERLRCEQYYRWALRDCDAGHGRTQPLGEPWR